MISPIASLFDSDERVIVGAGVADDAGVFRLDDHAMIATADFITPPVEDPYLAQLAGVISNLISGGRPLTLFTIGGSATGPFFGAADEAAKAWLVRAWKYYDSICSP